MATDDLTRPLGRQPKKAAARSPLLRRAASGVVGAVVLAAAGWLLMVENPDSGEPVAVVPIDQSVASLDPAPVGAVSTEPAAAPDDAPIRPHEIVIRDASAGGEIRLFTEAVDGLLERTAFGLVPRVGSSGIRPIDAYARPDASGGGTMPRVALILTGLGQDSVATGAAISRLPGVVSLAFSPHGEDLERWVERARDGGHEVLLELPFDAEGTFRFDAGAAPAENIASLHGLLSRMTRYAGVVGVGGQRLLADEAALRPIISEIGARGLLYVDDGRIEASMAPEVAAGLAPVVIGDFSVGADESLAVLREQLRALEEMALERGYAVGIAAATPMAIEVLAGWLEQLRGRGLAATPVTALARG